MPISPFIEAANIRTIEQPVSGGMDTRDIDRFRQGVSIQNNNRHCGVQPKLNPTRESQHIIRQNFGINARPDQPEYFDDRKKQYRIGAIIDHFMSGTVSITEAFINAVDDDGNIELYDSTIEPLQIREAVLLPNDLNHIISKQIISELAEGNVNRKRAGDLVLQEYNNDAIVFSSPYIDMSAADAFISAGSYMSGLNFELISPVQEQDRILIPFDDSSALNSHASSDVLSSKRSNLNAVIAILSGSSDCQ
jgi:hypothetical protein